MKALNLGNYRALVFTTSGAKYARLQEPVVPPSELDVVAAAEYVDTAGNLQQLVADLDTTPVLTGVAPFYVWFNAANTRSPLAPADTEGGAWTALHYRFNSGEGIAGNWPFSGQPRNILEGPGVGGHLFTQPGTHSATWLVADADGREGLVTFSVQVLAPGAGVDVSEAAGSWPALANNMILNLAAGSNHNSKGDLNLSGYYGILVRKVGEGADPIVSRINFDHRYIQGSPVQRTRNCRIQNINVAIVAESIVGSLYCAIHNHTGSMRFVTGPADWYWLNQATGQVQKDNIHYTRGMCWWNVNEITSNPEDGGYVLIWGAKNSTFRNCDFNKTSGGDNSHVLRGGHDGCDLRHNRFRVAAAADTMSYNKIQGWNNVATFDAWSVLDLIGPWNGVPYRPVCRHVVIEHNVYGAAGSNNATGTNIEIAPENNTSPAQAIELVSVANNRWYESSFGSAWSNAFAGRYIYAHNNKLNMGAGAETPYVTGVDTDRLPSIPTGWNGPYVFGPRPPFSS